MPILLSRKYCNNLGLFLIFWRIDSNVSPLPGTTSIAFPDIWWDLFPAFPAFPASLRPEVTLTLIPASESLSRTCFMFPTSIPSKEIVPFSDFLEVGEIVIDVVGFDLTVLETVLACTVSCTGLL